jgi:aldose 1-epimerase
MSKIAAVRRSVLGVLSTLVLLAGAARASSIEEKEFGKIDGQKVTQYILTNSSGASLRVINYGAIVTNLFIPDKNGKMGDVVLGFDKAGDYQDTGPYMGCVPGRFANRIAHGTFTIDGQDFAVTMNQGENCLHGGFKGWAKRMWAADAGMTPDGPTVRLQITDPDGEEGFPGTVRATVLYSLTNGNWLKIQYFATSDKPTPINLTHHSYFNLSGEGKGDVLGYVAKMYATRYLPVDSALIPTGDVARVAGTPFDFTKAKTIGQDIKSLPGDPPGYDHAMVLDNPKGELKEAAEVYDPASGRLVDCWTTEPAFHFYTAMGLKNLVGKGGQVYQPYQAFCMETEHYPDSPNHPDFPNTILRPGHVYRQLTEFRFSRPDSPLQPGQ